jgi:hypothetical protein
VVVHNGTAPRYALITSFESGPTLEAWISLLQVGTDTFRLPGAPTGARAELLALTLDVGGEVWASGPTAAALHGFDGYRLEASFRRHDRARSRRQADGSSHPHLGITRR